MEKKAKKRVLHVNYPALFQSLSLSLLSFLLNLSLTPLHDFALKDWLFVIGVGVCVYWKNYNGGDCEGSAGGGEEEGDENAYEGRDEWVRASAGPADGDDMKFTPPLSKLLRVNSNNNNVSKPFCCRGREHVVVRYYREGGANGDGGGGGGGYRARFEAFRKRWGGRRGSEIR